MSSLGLTRSGQIWFILALIVGITVLNDIRPRAAMAQEEAAAEKEGAGGGEAVEPKQNKSYFMWFIESSGFIGLVILILSIYFVSTVGRLFIEMRPQVAAPPEIVDEVEDMLQKRQFKRNLHKPSKVSLTINRMLLRWRAHWYNWVTWESVRRQPSLPAQNAVANRAR